MYATHGYHCNTRTFRTNCPSCKSNVYFFQCDHSSRVFFDRLGPPWPPHRCFPKSTVARPTPRPSGKLALTTMTDVTVSIEPQNDGLLTGMKRVSGSIDEDIVKRISQRPESNLRDIMRIDPIGSHRESLAGIVQDIVRLDLDESFDIESGTLGGQMISELFPNLKVTQITILVDEIATDPDAVDFLSYTVWCKPTTATESLSKGHIVSLAAMPTYIWGIGRKWLGSQIARIL